MKQMFIVTELLNFVVSLCSLASHFDEPMCVKLMEVICAEYQITLTEVEDNKKLSGRYISSKIMERKHIYYKVLGWD